MPQRAAASFTRTATLIALGVLLAVAMLPPLAWLGVGGLIEYRQARVGATAAAWLIRADSARPVLPPLADDSTRAGLLQALGLPLDGTRIEWPLAGAARPDQMASVGAQPLAPSFSVSVKLPPPNDRQADVRVQRSLRPLLMQGLWLALASCGLALAGWRFGLHHTVALVRRAETRMRALSSLDPLTGLLNQAGLRRRLGRALDRCRPGGTAVGLLLIDLDRFGPINETLGQTSGDTLLCSVADRIRTVTRAEDGLARLGGDQFAIQVGTRSGMQALTAMARNLRRSLDVPHVIDGRELVVTFSIGVAMVDRADGDAHALLYEATQALRAAKKQGGNRFCVYDGGGPADERAGRMELEQRMYGALAAGQFFLVYQPIVDARTEAPGTVEALLRWRDPDRGVVSPVEFIPALEQTGLIVPVGRWILHKACAQAARWPGGAPMHVSVNLSPLQFYEPDLLQMVAGVLRETGLPPQRLQLEVTEGLLLDPTPQTLHKINALGELGVRLAVDDFGMGYSSLIYLKRFRLHTLKIDRMFVSDIIEQPQDMTIVRAIIDLGHGLGMSVTAEGVETKEQAEALRGLGCDALQGYLFGRPATVEVLCRAGPEAGPTTLCATDSARAASPHPSPASCEV